MKIVSVSRDPTNPKFAEARKLPFSDRIVLDYALEELGHLDALALIRYIEALVSAINYRARMSGTEEFFTFVFKMAPEMWSIVSAIWACRTPKEDEGQTPVVELRAKWAIIQRAGVLTVFGIDYLVMLAYQDELTFEPQQDDAPEWLYGVIKNINKEVSPDESGGNRCWRYGLQSCPRICGHERGGLVRSS